MPRLKGDASNDRQDVPRLTSLSFQERLADGLDRLKSERGLTNKELGEQLGVSEAYMSQVTRGMRDVKLTTLDKMTREWNVTIEDLFTVTDDDLARIAAKKARRSQRKPPAVVLSIAAVDAMSRQPLMVQIEPKSLLHTFVVRDIEKVGLIPSRPWCRNLFDTAVALIAENASYSCNLERRVDPRDLETDINRRS